MFNEILAVTAAVVNSSELHPGTDPAAINGPMSVLCRTFFIKEVFLCREHAEKKEKSCLTVHHRASHKEGIPEAVTASIVPERRLELRRCSLQKDSTENLPDAILHEVWQGQQPAVE